MGAQHAQPYRPVPVHVPESPTGQRFSDPSEEVQPHPSPCPAGGRDAELEAAQLLLPPKEGSPAALGEARCPAAGEWRGRGSSGKAQARGATLSNSAGSPQSCARLRLVARGLADAQAVLKSLPSPELFPGVPPTLELLAAAGRDVAACVSISGFGPSTPRGLSARSVPPRGRRILDLSP